MAKTHKELLKEIKVIIVDDMPDLSNDPAIRRQLEFAKDFMRKHPHPEIIEIDGDFNYVPFNRRISEKVSKNNL